MVQYNKNDMYIDTIIYIEIWNNINKIFAYYTFEPL